MPMFVLVIRFGVELIFRLNYSLFFSNLGPTGTSNYSVDDLAQERALRLINGTISELIDPNLNYSRLSFLESGKEAVDLKYELGKGRAVGPH